MLCSSLAALRSFLFVLKHFLPFYVVAMFLALARTRCGLSL